MIIYSFYFCSGKRKLFIPTKDKKKKYYYLNTVKKSKKVDSVDKEIIHSQGCDSLVRMCVGTKGVSKNHLSEF